MSSTAALRSENAQAGQKIANALSWAVLAVGAVAIVAMAVLVVRGYSPMPYSDQWHILDMLAKANGAPGWNFFWRQHNEHRLVFPKLFYVADLVLFGGKNIFLIGSIFALQLAHAALWLWLLRRLADYSRAWLRTAGGIIAFCLFRPNQAENFVWGFQVCFILVTPALALSLAALVLWTGDRKKSATPKPPPYLQLAFLAAIIASFSLANGLLVWPLLLVAAFALRAPRWVPGSVAVSGALIYAAYFRHFQPEQRSLGVAVHSPRFVPDYVLSYFGGSWMELSIGFGEALAAIAAVAVVLWYLRALVRRRVNAWRIFVLSMAMFALLSSLLTAVGRLRYGADTASLISRYQTIAMLFWLAVALLALDFVRAHAGPRSLAVLQATFLVPMLVSFSSVPTLEQNLIWRRRVMNNATLAVATFAADVSTTDFVPTILSYPKDYAGAIWLLKVNHAWIYSDRFYAVLDGPLSHSFQSANAGACEGELSFVLPIAADPQRGWRVRGWAWDVAANRPAQKVLLATSDGTVIGVARNDSFGIPFPYPLPQSARPDSGFFGFMRGISNPAPVTAYALLDHEKEACPITAAISK